ncbi:unnamed protein product, partial [Meganyctiphanes norvegica]
MEKTESGSVSTISGSIRDGVGGGDGVVGKKGLHYLTAAFFVITQMMGAGFLALPHAVADAGWFGVPMMVLFCSIVGFSGTRLGASWEIMEERWPEYKTQSCRQAYMEIAYRAFGDTGRKVCMAAVVVGLMGSTTVFAILAAQMLNSMVTDLSQCEWLLIVGAVLAPLTWFGTPKDFWQFSVGAVLATLTCVLIIFIQLLVDESAGLHPEPEYRNPTLITFSLSFGSILFAFAGAKVFPTIQNDMANRSEFGKSVVLAFIVVTSLYLLVAVTGYATLGFGVKSNILLSLNQDSAAVTVAKSLQIVNLVGTYILSFNTIGQALEDMLGLPKNFCWQRVVLRTSLVCIEVLIGLGLPDFGKLLDLIGGSIVTTTTFILPTTTYM